MENNERFEQVIDDHLEFDRIPQVEKRHSRHDVCAFIYLSELFPGKTSAMIASASHDEIWLDVTSEEIESLSDYDILYLIRCGVRYDNDNDSLAMFA